MTRERIVFFGLFGGTNLGNEATLASCLAALRARRPDAVVECVGYARDGHPGSGIVAHAMDPWPVGRWPGLHRLRDGVLRDGVFDALTLASEHVRVARARAVLVGASQFVVPGTGVVDDFGQRSVDMPLHLLRWCRAARDAGVPPEFLSVGVSRVGPQAARRRFRTAIDLAAHFTVRDVASSENARRLGCATPDVVPDLAFGLPLNALGAAPPPQWPPRVVGLGVMGYRGWNVSAESAERIHAAYLDRIERVARSLMAGGLQLRIVHGDTRADQSAVDELVRRLERGGASDYVAEPVRSYRDALAELARCDLVVATRYHNVLFAILLGRPVVSLGYGDKNDALLADFDLQASAWNVEEFDATALVEHVCDIARLPRSPGALFNERLGEFRRRVDAQYDAVFGAVPARRADAA